jgi:hypothetical protein
MIYRYGESRRQRARKKLYRNLSLFGPPVAVLVVGVAVAFQQGKLSVLAELGGGQNPAGSYSGNVARNAKQPPKVMHSSTKKGAAVLSSDAVRTSECNITTPKRAGLAGASVPQLRKLAEYEAVCNAAIAERATFFVPTPKEASEAESFAAYTASVLKEFAKYGVSPLVIIEPANNGTPLNSKQYMQGAFDPALDAYFAALKTDGITDQMMGMWVPFPEGNIPVWDSVNADEFAANVTRTIKAQKKYFPASKAAVLLDSKTYPSATSWEGGAYKSLVPYVSGIEKGLVDSFGLQGFPWAPPASEGGPASYDPAVYLPARLAIDAARTLGVKDAWFNTGTFSRSHAKKASDTVYLAPRERQVMLDGMLKQVDALKTAGLSPSLHIFAENKADTLEGIDWSYWAKGKAAESPATPVFKTLIHDAAAKGVPLWIFDTDS